MKTQWYVARVDYQTTAGNPVTAEIKVRAINEDKALEAAIEKVMRWKRCMKVVGGNCVPFNSPAPTDWEAELKNIEALRTKALNCLFSMSLPEAGITFNKTDGGYNRAKMVQGFLLVGADSLQQADLPEHLTTIELVQVVNAIEKALAAGGQKP